MNFNDREKIIQLTPLMNGIKNFQTIEFGLDDYEVSLWTEIIF